MKVQNIFISKNYIEIQFFKYGGCRHSPCSRESECKSVVQLQTDINFYSNMDGISKTSSPMKAGTSNISITKMDAAIHFVPEKMNVRVNVQSNFPNNAVTGESSS